MKLDKWLVSATKTLQAKNVGTARLDCLILLSDALGKDKAWILAHPEINFQGGTLEMLNKQIERRSKHEPMAYIRGFTEFYGRKFLINKDVLEPRPESETMIELLKELVNSEQLTVDCQSEKQKLQGLDAMHVSKDGSWKNEMLTIVDIGTGSGAIGITVKLEFPSLKVIGTDIDKKCLVVARQNAKKLNADIEFLQGNLLEPLDPIPYTLSAILANLPYVPDRWAINEAAAMEPRIAIFGGPDGLELYRQMFEQIDGMKIKPNYIFTESLPPQHENLAKIAKKSGYKLLKSQDFIQLFKIG